MRILMISDVYFPRINGVSTSIRSFRTQLQQTGHEVVLIAPEYHAGGGDGDDADIIRIRASRVPFDAEDRLMHGSRIGKLMAAIRQRHFDVIHIQTPFVAHRLGLRLSRELGIPCIETYHTFFEEYLYNYIPLLPKRWLKSLARNISTRQCNRVDHVIVPSTAMQQVLTDYGISTDMTILPTGIESSSFQQGDRRRFRQRYNIPEHRPVLLNVSRVAYEKNIDFLIRMLTRVWQEIPDILLIIAGDGPAKAHLQRLTGRLGLRDNVLFLGYLDREQELNDCYCGSDLFVFASRTETQGLVLLEAMALGLPVISTAVLGTKDLLQDNPGASTADEDEIKFACRVTRLLNNQLQRKSMQHKAIEFAGQWTAPVMTQRLLQLYQQVCGMADMTDTDNAGTDTATGTGMH